MSTNFADEVLAGRGRQHRRGPSSKSWQEAGQSSHRSSDPGRAVDFLTTALLALLSNCGCGRIGTTSTHIHRRSRESSASLESCAGEPVLHPSTIWISSLPIFAEVYVREDQLTDLVARYELDADAERPNVVIQVVGADVWPFGDTEEVAPWPVVAIDLLDALDERTRRAGRDLIERHVVIDA